MKKFILPIILLLTAVLFLPPKADAQTRQECEKTRDRASYNCLLGFGKCYSPCVAETKDNMGCRDSCKQAENACDEEVDTQYKICLETLPKTKENTPTEKAEQVEAQTNPDCHEVFTKESNSCLKESTKCIDSCVEKGNAAMSLTVDGAKVSLECQRNVCDPASTACNDKAMANFRACQDAGKQPAASEAKKGINVFKIFELFQEAVLKMSKNTDSEETWKKIKFWEKPATKEKAPPFEMPKQERNLSTQGINDWIMENDLKSDPARLEQMEREKLDLELYGRTPQMTEEIIKQYQEEWKKMYDEAETKPKETPIRVRVDYIKGDAVYKLPGSDEWINVKSGDILPKGATLFTGMDSTVLLSMQDKGVFQMLSFTETVISEQEIKGNSFTDIQLRTGEIEASVERGVFTAGFQISTPASTTGTRGTHFWVYYDKNKDVAVTGVYKGEVEVKTKGSNKTALVAPNGSKPGIAVVSQKFSSAKLALAVLVLVAVAGGTAILIRKKFAQRAFDKKKK